ncbi:serine hydrolase [Castellaniella caeni]|uniref:serine hydrolase n=1 Tax=Castellaniella caeni TaxID=266123 RepID=UPI000A053837|nr:serine hydrolase [Castellaniella caeni]
MVLHQLRAAVCGAAVGAVLALFWPAWAQAQIANFHPCNAQPALPVCQHGYGKRIAVKRWGAIPDPLDPDAAVNAPLVTGSPARDVRKLRSSSALVQDVRSGEILFARGADDVRPIASITKLMTALVVVEAGLPMDETLRIEASDVQVPSELPSRLAIGTRLSRADLLHVALTSSENSAAHALGRTYPGGMGAFVDAMNARAHALGMDDSRFVEPVGLSNENVSSARDLAKLLAAAARQPLIQAYTTDTAYETVGQVFRNTNMLVGRANWDILASKTGTTREAGNCLVMMVALAGRPLAVVLLDAQGMNGARFGDAVRLRRIVSSQLAAEAAAGVQPPTVAGALAAQ